MKIKTLLITLLTICVSFTSKAQTPSREDSLKGFSMEEMNHHLEQFKGTLEEKNKRIVQSQRAFINRKYKLGAYNISKMVKDINARMSSNPNLQATNCTNIGFENGNTTGWTMGGNTDAYSTGSATTGDNFITSGAGLDPFGNYPVVYSGSYSLKLSDNNLSTTNFLSTASRVISVASTGNTFFTIDFALDILDYPHTLGDQAIFKIDVYDAAGNILPCPQYECYHTTSGDVGVTSFQKTNSSNLGTNLGGQTFPVTYTPWQTETMDLTAYAGTNVTCVASCCWCIYNYDWAYCYIDADCPASNTSTVPTCGTLPFALSGPTGFSTYSWVTPPGNSPTTASTYSINASVAGTYTVHCSLNTCTTTAAYTFTYNVEPGPTPNFTNTLTSCSGNGSFASTSTTNGGPALTGYTWEWGDGTANGTTANTTHDYSTSGTKTVTLVITNGTCIDSISKTVVIPPHPTASFTNANNCLNATSNFTSTSTSSVAINTQTWHFGDGGSGSGTPINHTYTSAGTYSVTLSITDANSCTDSVTKTITINPLPTITANSSTICGGIQTATLTANGASTYTWTPTTLTPSTGSVVTGTPTVTTNYTITGTDANGCVNTTTTAISISPNPTITTNSSSICIGQTATLTANGAFTYTWAPATLTPSTGSVVTGIPNTTTNYTVTGTNTTGCVGTATAAITVNPLPTITVNSSTICLGQQTATLTANGAVTYSWNPTTGLSPTSGSAVEGTPATTTNYTVAGTDANGCINTATSTITVNPSPPLTVSSSTICVGQQTATLTANGASTYTWIPATVTPSTGSVVTGSPIATTQYTVTGTNATSCVSTATTVITVNLLPNVAVSSSTICLGQQTATLTASGAITYFWNPTTGLNPTTGSPITGTPAITTTYVVTGTDANGCTNTAIATINVNQPPLPVATSNTPCASQQPLNLNCTPAGLNYNWTGPNAYTSALQNPTVAVANVTIALDGIYTVSVIDGNNCTNTVTVNIIVNPLPVISVSGSTVCIGQTITLSCLPSGDNYSWSGPNGYTSSSQNVTIPNSMPNMAGNYAVVITDANTLCFSGDVAIAIVNPLPIISVNTTTICLGQETGTLTAIGASTYTWTSANTLSSDIGSTVNATPNATTTYTVTGTDDNGCINDTTTTVTVNNLPIISTSSVTPGCIPLSASFTATSSPAASSYTWNFSNGQGSHTSVLNPSSSFFITSTIFTLAATYPVNLSVTDINGCVSTATTITMAYPLPVANFAYHPQPVTIDEPEVQFFNQSSGAIITNFNWNFGDIYSNNDTSSLVNPSHLYSDTGTYIVTLSVTSNFGCTATVVEPLVVTPSYAIYVPNAFTPNGDGKNEIFKALGEGINTFTLYIFDRWGNRLFFSTDINVGWDGTFQGKSNTILQEDVYVWKIDLTDYTNTHKSLHGTVTLVK